MLIAVSDLAWQRVPDTAVFVNAELRGAAFGPGEWVVVGSIWPDPEGDGLPRAAVWHSLDGMEWDLVSDDPVVFPELTRILDVHWAPTAGYVAVGFAAWCPQVAGFSRRGPPRASAPGLLQRERRL